MPNLTQLALSGEKFKEEFFSTLNAKASTIQGSFHQVRKGNFRFQENVDSFLQPVTYLQCGPESSPHYQYVVHFSDLLEEEEEEDEEDSVSDEEDDLSWTSQPSEYLQEPHNGSVQPSRPHSWIEWCSIV
eukprot:XP_011673999.1 PREDICTED: uncharacterized protein LOC105442978 [Strongylocentrotus purpuratus]